MLDQQVAPMQVLAEPKGVAPVGPAALLEWHQFAAATLAPNLSELDQPNLLGALQALTKRRDELRQIDKQLFDMMAECFVRLKPVHGVASSNSCSDTSSGFGECLSSPASSPDDNAAMDLSRLAEASNLMTKTMNDVMGAIVEPRSAKDDTNDHGGRQQAGGFGKQGKRSNLTSPSLHFKKQRLLSAIISTDDIGEKQQVLAEKELDVRNDGRPGESDEQQQQSLQLVGRHSSSYQQLNHDNHHQAEYQQQQQLRTPSASTPTTTTTTTSALELPPASYHDQKQPQPFLLDASAAASIRRQFQLQLEAANSAGSSDQEDDAQAGAGERPQLKKFCSIGTAEMSFERFSRRQFLIDSTLATLTHGQQQQQQQLPPPALPAPADESQAVQVHRATGANCFSIEMAGTSREEDGLQLAAPLMAAPTTVMMMPPSIAHHQPDLMHRLYDQFLHHKLPTSGGQLIAELPLQANSALVPQSAQEQQLATPLYVFQQQHQQQLFQQQQHLNNHNHQLHNNNNNNHNHNHHHHHHQKRRVGAPSAFDRLLVNAKDLGPIVRKMSFRCHVCSSCFEDRHRLQQHLSIHLNLNPSWFEEKTIKETMAQYEMRRGDYLCQTCQMRFETTSEFDKHMHLHGEKPHQCELCSQDNKFVSFRYFRQLLTHLRSHCFLYSCRFVPECRQTANRKDYLKLHILKHHLNNKLPEQYTICCH